MAAATRNPSETGRRGPGTTMAFALKLVERLSGAAVAKTTSERLLAPR
jgi:hypothetical protein